MGASFSLIIEDDAGKQIVVPFARDVITIGRKEGNTIRLTERNVSRFHAKLSRENGSVLVEDLKSFNGVKLNGDRIAGRVQVAAGDVIEIGDYHLELRSNAAAQTAKLGLAHKSAGVADAPAADEDEFEGDTQRWEPPPAALKVSVGGLATAEQHVAPSPFGDSSGDTERLDLSAAPLSAQQAWPPPPGRAKPPSLTTAELEPTARQPIANVPIGGIAPPPPALAPLSAPSLSFAPTSPAPPAPPQPAPAAPAVAIALEPLDEATQDMPLPAAQAFARGHSARTAEMTEQLKPSPAMNPADDVSLPRLVVLNTTFAGSIFPLRAAENVIGRTDDNDIVLEHKSVSRNHAKLVRESERVRILDLKSANGVLVNGQEVDQHSLRSGDVIELGRVRIRFVPVGERFSVPPDEIERARVADAANDFDEGSQTVNVTSPLCSPAPVAAAPKPMALYAVVAVLVVVVTVLLVVVLSRGGGDPTTETPPAAPVPAVTAASTPTDAPAPPAPTAGPPAPPAPVIAAPPIDPPPAPAPPPEPVAAAAEADPDDGSDKPKKPKAKPKVDVKAALAEAQGLMLRHKLSDAVRVLLPAASSNSPEVHYQLGVAYSRLRELEKSRHHYTQFLKLQPAGPLAERVRTILGS